MAKLACAPLLVFAACAFAGFYGALHNQVSYTVSPGYFHKFKFDQFQINKPLRGRLGASLVGAMASWWMGFLIGIPLALVGLVIPGWRAYVTHVLFSFLVVVCTAFVIGFGALLYASVTITDGNLPDYWYPAHAVNKVAFARAGTMHNYSYLGGGLGVLTGSIYLAVVRVRIAMRRTRVSPANCDRGPL
jgi:ABC-type dipeptide/oligopeptide/nickel transport system permease component